MLKEENTYSKQLFKAILVILFYLTAYSYPDKFALILGINLDKLSIIPKIVFLITYETSILLIVIYSYKDELIPSFKNFIKNIKEYFNKYFKYWILMLVLMVLSNYIISFFTVKEVATNQEIIVDTLKKAPIYTIISTILIAPLLEELIFRFSIKKIIPNLSIIYILVSGLAFGSMHVLLTMTNISDLLFIIPYSIPGIIFAYLYNKTNNIFIPAGIHFMHNAILISLQIILSLV